MASIYDTPAGRNERRLQQEIRLRRTYADMPVTLGLDAAQAGKLFDLLTDSQMTANGPSGFPGAWGGTQPADPAAREQRDAAIEDLLGPEKAAEFQSYEKSIPARMQVGRMGESMAAANVPLSETQKSALIAVVASEQQSAPPPQRPADGSSNPDYQTQFLDWQADYSHRVQVRVEPLLTPEQVTLYREAAEVQNARRAEQRTRVEARRSVANGQ
jgi:hypothetical protein